MFPRAALADRAMQLRLSASGIEVWTSAKLNLFLEVLAQRDDGYHEIETLMCPIDLYDTLWFRSLDRDVAGSDQVVLQQCETRALGDSQLVASLPRGCDNLAVRAVNLVRRKAGVEHGAELRLVKRIPVAAGLGGGSSDAAAALVAANHAWRLGYSRPQLADWAAELGSDVPFFVHSLPAIGRGRGERLELLNGLGRWHFVVVTPAEGLKTAEVYRHCQVAGQPDSPADLITALKQGDRRRVGALLRNRLQGAAQTLSPWIAQINSEFSKLQVEGHQMTGSGSSCFALCRSHAHARHLAAKLRARGWGIVHSVTTC
jgi:4-diphosphocytidyl-2-C-methyl-D-erythritol kinase